MQFRGQHVKQCCISRRSTLSCLIAGPLAATGAKAQQEPVALANPSWHSNTAQYWSQADQTPSSLLYAQQGPLLPLELPHLEHTCTSCFPACVGNKCLLKIEVTYPKGGSKLSLFPPYPLAIFCGGFTVDAAAYRSTAARLASWGYTVVRYATRDALPDVLDDVTCVQLVRELIDWAGTHPLMRQLADAKKVYLAGHSRGGKLAALTAAADTRVAALCLMDPVDVTQYAPLSERFPSAAAALAGVAQTGRFLPLAVVGSGQSGDCAPLYNNYQRFFQAAPSAAWEVLLPAAGHFQYLDTTTPLQRAVCGAGPDAPADSAVRAVSQATLVAWGETMVKQRGMDVVSRLADRAGDAGYDVTAGYGGSYQSTSSSSTKGRQMQPPQLVATRLLCATESSQHSLPADGNTTPAAARGGHAAARRQKAAGRQAAEGQASPPPSAAAAARGGQAAPVTAAGSALAAAAAAIRQQTVSSNGSDCDSQQQRQQHLPSSLKQGQIQLLVSDKLQLQQQQQQQQQAGPVPLSQTRQEVWLAEAPPSPAQLRLLQSELEQLLMAVAYQATGPPLGVRSQYKNFG